MLANVEAALALPYGLVRDDRVEPVWARRFARQSAEKTARALEPFGYYHASIETELVIDADDAYRLMVRIDPGEPVRVARQSIVLSGPGAEDARLRQLRDEFPLVAGNRLRHDRYEEWKADLLAQAVRLGYLRARFVRHEVRVSLADRQAEIDLELATGPRYFFGMVDFIGADQYPLRVLRRYLTFRLGEPFAEEQLARTQANFLDADRFRRVHLQVADVGEDEQTVPVQVELEPLPRYRLRPGIGYGTDTGARTSLRFQNLNVLQLGHDLRADLLYAEKREALTGTYAIPVTERLDSLLELSVAYRRDLQENFDSRSLATEASLTRGLPRHLKASIYLSLLQEWFEVGEEESQRTTLLMPGLRLGQRRWTFHAPGRPRSGYAWQAEVRGAAKQLFSDVSLLQGLVSANTIIDLPYGLLLILRAEGGGTLQDDFDAVPASMRFFAGGDQSVRGFAYKSLGPKDSQGNVIGGRHLAVFSAEIDKSIGENWSVALFFDAGNAFDSPNDYELAKGAGIGLRRHTPVGPLKFDLAKQIGAAGSYRLHLSVGFIW